MSCEIVPRLIDGKPWSAYVSAFGLAYISASDNVLRMPFEVFKRQRVRPSAVPYVTVHKRGTISFSIAAAEALGNPAAVELLYDRDSNAMGMRPVDEDQPHAYRLRSSGRNGSIRVISGTAFFQYYGLPPTGASRFVGRLENGMLVIDLGAPESGSPLTTGAPQAPVARRPSALAQPPTKRKPKQFPEPIKDP